MNDSLRIRQIDYRDADEARALIGLLDAYAQDPMGGGTALSEAVRAGLAERLAAFPGAFSLVARMGDRDIGLANCFMGFSTFACRPLINVHDLVVLESARGRGVATRLLDAVGEEARRRDCCKVTLEVLEGNQAAFRCYQQAGFEAYRLPGAPGHAIFMARSIG